MIAAGIDVKTRRPNMDGLEIVLRAAVQLHGERHAPELPIPTSAVREYADRFGLSDRFVQMVLAYDRAIADGYRRKTKARMEKPQPTKG